MLSSIRARVVCACVSLVAFSVVSTTVANYTTAKANDEAAIAHDLTTYADDHAKAIGDWIAAKTLMVSSLQDAALTTNPDPMLKQIAVAGGFFDVGVGYPDRTAKFTDWPNIPASYDPTSRPWYKGAAQAGKSVAIPYVSTSGQLLVALAVPVIRDGILKAVLVGDVALDSVVESVKSIHPTPASFGVLVDQSGRVIAHPDPKLRFKPVSDIAPDLAKVTTTSGSTGKVPLQLTVDGKAKLVRAQAVAGTDWHVVVSLDKSEATAGIRSLLTASLISLVIIVGIATVVCFAITTTVFRRLAEVCHAMAAIGSGTGSRFGAGEGRGSSSTPSFGAARGRNNHLVLDVGDRVSHDKYGLGTVLETRGSGPTATVVIDFGSAGKVRLMLVGGVPMVKL